MKISWQNVGTLDSRSFICGYCNNPVASEKGFFGRNDANIQSQMYVYICHHCNKATYFDGAGTQTPSVAYGQDVKHIDDLKIQQLYHEARKCFSTNSFTAVVLSCRKLLMHIAVAKGCRADQAFIKYVEYLSEKSYIPPGAQGWVDHIREKGNEANHEIKIMTEDEARDLISFIEMLLKIVYEFPANIRSVRDGRKVAAASKAI